MENLILTEDGSHSLRHNELNETYHSIHGAIQESVHIFIESGLKKQTKDHLHVLEIGLGTGLNAFLTLIETSSTFQKTHYTAIELYPLSVASACLLNYPDILAPDKKDTFYQLHTAPWQNHIQLTPQFELYKIREDFSSMTLSGQFDLVYFDAFSPEKQPEMWTEDRFRMIYNCCNPGAILTTYCAKGNVRRALQAAGFSVERIPGPPGKREMLRALKD
ncbi:MAG: tRNA (5-methylaminomethyl-2-thiouridine)(34)-methyltransferase MnmD [Paludibacter sp.]|nr:tRNA (5-methylaminomethyl-2-thiouridine)(34)-methyltransferase MnmD [Paludibacter sp.]MDD4199389.1 tRNA (5-methylaminomethyl-2-thiouridine)(34)-methyltransferase MnmD [Paludibacter sp.]